MLQYARLKPGPGFEPGRAAAYYSQRLVIEPHARALITKTIASAINVRRPRTRSEAPEKMATDLNCLRAAGLLQLSPLDQSYVDRIIESVQNEKVILPDNSARRFNEIGRTIPAAAYPLSTIFSCPGVFSLAQNSYILSLVQDYLGCAPTLSSIGLRWSLPTEGSKPDTQSFHRDMDDWRSVKYFIYLTDVSEDTGPHTYIRGSHKSRSRLRAKPYNFAEINARFGKDAAFTVTGPRGTSFLADVYGIHRGSPPKTGPRLILQFQYSVLPVYAFKYQPVMDLPTGVDKYLFRLFARRPCL